MPAVKVFATRGSDNLARMVAQYLQLRMQNEELPVTLGIAEWIEFSNDNTIVQIDDVRGSFVVVIHTQVPPVNDRLVDFFHLLSAIRDARSKEVLVVFPYMPYARSDKKDQPRISTFSKDIADILVKVYGVKRVILLDPHDIHIKHYFAPLADEISAIYLLMDHVKRTLLISPEIRENSVIVFSDAGAAKRYEQVPDILGLLPIYINKRRIDHTENPIPVAVVGDVTGRHCIIFDDEIETGNTVTRDAEFLVENGAKSVFVVAVHAVLAKKGLSAKELIGSLESSWIEKLIVTDTIPTIYDKLDNRNSDFVTVLSIAGLLAEAIARAIMDVPMTDLYQIENVDLYRPIVALA